MIYLIKTYYKEIESLILIKNIFIEKNNFLRLLHGKEIQEISKTNITKILEKNEYLIVFLCTSKIY